MCVDACLYVCVVEQGCIMMGVKVQMIDCGIDE